MKRTTCVLTVFAMVMLTYAPARAQNVFIGTLDGNQTYRFELSGSNGSAAGAVTVYWLKEGGIIDIDLFSGEEPAQDVTIPRRARRVVFMVAPAPNAQVLFKVSQGSVVVEENVSIGKTYVFDIVF